MDKEMRIIDRFEESIMKYCKLNDIKYERTEDYFVDDWGKIGKAEGTNNYDFDKIVPNDYDKESLDWCQRCHIETTDIRSPEQRAKEKCQGYGFQPWELHNIKKQLGFSKDIGLKSNLRNKSKGIVKGFTDQLELFTDDVYQQGYAQGLEQFRDTILDYLREMENKGRKRLAIKLLAEEILKIKEQILEGYIDETDR